MKNITYASKNKTNNRKKITEAAAINNEIQLAYSLIYVQ